jgi:hypothetical protein
MLLSIFRKISEKKGFKNVSISVVWKINLYKIDKELLFMLGIIDRFYVFTKSIKGYEDHNASWKFEIEQYNGKETSWFCFIPNKVARRPLLRKGLIPNEGDVFIYTLSSLNLIKPNPEQTARGLTEIYNDVTERINQSLEKGHALNFLGVSLGNVLSIRAAGNSNSNIEKLVSIVGGGRLGLSAWDSLLTRHIARQSELRSPEEYEKKLSEFSPLNNIEGITANEIIIRLGTADLLIPYKYGQELASALITQGKRTGAKIDYKAYRGADHSTAIFLSALDRNIRTFL